MSTAQLTKFVSRLDLSDARVDREKNIIKGVSLVSLGEARGHGEHVDKITLKQVADCAKQYQGGLRVKWNPSTFNHGDGSLAGSIPSDSIRVKGSQVVGDLHVYKSFPHRDYLFDIAEETPGNFGLSMEFSGVSQEIDAKKYARCDEIFAVAIVDIPAANPTGLFKAKDDDEKENEGLTMTPEELKKFSESIANGVAAALKPSLDSIDSGIKNFKANTPAAPTKEELEEAGVTDKDTDEEKASKVAKYRKNADEPVTMRSLMQFFRMTGGKPARPSGGKEGTGDLDKEDDDTTTHPFEKRVQKYTAAGMPSAKAIMRAKNDDAKGYNEWVAKGGSHKNFAVKSDKTDE